MRLGPPDPKDRSYVKTWFDYPGAPHVATLRPDGWLIWAKPNTGIYRVDYHCHGRYLIVVGDIGDAVFAWSQNVDWDFLASCSLDYFLSKCQASPSGRDFYQWSGDHMRAILADHLTDDEDGGTAKLTAAIEDGAHYHIDDEQEWYAWVKDNTEHLGSDYGEWIMNGRIASVHAVGIFEGLKLAVAQLKERGELP